METELLGAVRPEEAGVTLGLVLQGGRGQPHNRGNIQSTVKPVT